eukprot:scaffold4400_cov98-Skeletonema_dohrnii-CCMP3373.AAC.1
MVMTVAAVGFVRDAAVKSHGGVGGAAVLCAGEPIHLGSSITSFLRASVSNDSSLRCLGECADPDVASGKKRTLSKKKIYSSASACASDCVPERNAETIKCANSCFKKQAKDVVKTADSAIAKEIKSCQKKCDDGDDDCEKKCEKKFKNGSKSVVKSV